MNAASDTVFELASSSEIKLHSYLVMERILQILCPKTISFRHLVPIEVSFAQIYRIWNTPGYYYTMPVIRLPDLLLKF